MKNKNPKINKNMQKTYEQLIEIDELVGFLYQENPELKKTKFGYAYDVFFKKNVLPTTKEESEDVADMRLKYALADEKTGEILYDRANPANPIFKFNRDGQLAVNQQTRQIKQKYGKKVIKIQPYISAYVPPGLTEEQKEILSGVLINI